MIETLADQLSDCIDGTDGFCAVDAKGQVFVAQEYKLAHAVLEAIRMPSARMLDAAKSVPQNPHTIWDVMVDEAIREAIDHFGDDCP
jgi:hypothetical protein